MLRSWPMLTASIDLINQSIVHVPNIHTMCSLIIMNLLSLQISWHLMSFQTGAKTSRWVPICAQYLDDCLDVTGHWDMCVSGCLLVQ